MINSQLQLSPRIGYLGQEARKTLNELKASNRKPKQQNCGGLNY